MFLFSSPRIEPRSGREIRMLVIAFVLLVFLVALDQITKAAVVANIPYHTYREVIPGFFDISHVTNTGAAWGMFHNSPWFPFGISIAAFILIAIFFRKITDGCAERFICMTMIVSGIIGNCSDRIFRGAVIDFLRFHWHDAAEWPSFNVADSAIVCGVILFSLSSLLRKPEKPEAEENGSDQAQEAAAPQDSAAAD